jgi:serine/threonine protein kinase
VCSSDLHVTVPSLFACLKEEKTRELDGLTLEQKKSYQKLFREEAEILSRLRHPYLPTFLNYIEMPDNEGGIAQFLILSFAEGEPLDKLLEQGGPIDDEHICWILDRILGALGYLHGKWNIVHCDLKPANVIVQVPEHMATVVDFGLASVNPVEWSKAKGGTPGFLPPEFGAGMPPIPASDVYSVGKIGLALAGGDPCKGTFPADMAPALRDFLEPMILFDPVLRPQSVDKLRHELETLRLKVWKRTSCLEVFKHRKGVHK